MKKRPVLRMAALVLCAAVLCAFASCAAGAVLTADDIYDRISQLDWLASSGVGAWEGVLRIDPAGNFDGEYYDADYDIEYQVVFYGLFGDPLQVSDTTWRLTVLTADTEEEPGTETRDEGGNRIVYEETLFPEGSEWLLTLPGTPDEEIPETVRGEIGGTWWEWDDYSDYFTLTRVEDGWGFFAPGDGTLYGPGTAGAAPTEEPQTVDTGNGLLPIPGKQGVLQIPLSYITATSYIVNSNQPDMFVPDRMNDGIETTCWQFSTGVTRLGDAYIYVDFSVPATADELWIKNGFWKISDGLDQYTRNSRLKKITVDFQYAGEYGYRDPVTITLKDDKERKDWQVLQLGGRSGVTAVRIRILDTYKGSKYKSDVAVSEIMFVSCSGN